MWTFLKKQALYVLAGFVVTFVVYLFVQFDSDRVLLGILVGAGGGVALALVLFLLERRFPDRPPQR